MKQRNNARRTIAAVTAILIAAVSGVSAQPDVYPSRPATIIVPFAAGGGTDVAARIIAQRLTDQFGMQFVIENRTGAGSNLGAAAAARAAPDGYTLLLATNTVLLVNPVLYKSLPFNPQTDFVVLAAFAQVPFFLVTSPKLQIRTIPDLISLAKQKPKQLSFGSSGLGSTPHMFMETFVRMTGIEMTHVPYRGSAPALTDVIAGHVSMIMADAALGIEMSKSGQAPVLGISSKTRHPEALNVPSIDEAGVPGYDRISWVSLVAPARTPRPIVERLNAEIKAISVQPEFRTQLSRVGMAAREIGSLEDVQQFVARELATSRELLTQMGLAGSL